MINLNKICVFDFETDSINPETTNPVELAAVMIDPRKLEIIEGSEFNTDIRPDNIKDPNYYQEHRDTIDFHSRVRGVNHEAILARWDAAPSLEQVWANFHSYTDKYHSNQSRKTKFSAPIPAGHNIINFDLPIVKRINERFKITNMFHARDRIDSLLLSFMWFENMVEPTAYNFDELRGFIGLSKAGAHTALQDVKDSAVFITKMFQLHRKIAPKVTWKS